MNYASIAADHIPEPDANESRGIQMGVGIGDHLGYSFGGAHHTHRVNSFVSGNQDKSLHSRPVGGFDNMVYLASVAEKA